MTVLGTLLHGEGPPVLQTCRFEGRGGQVYGREAIGGLLAALRPSLAVADLDIETDRLGLWMDADHAVVADIGRGLVQRLWILGEQETLDPPSVLNIPIDPDLNQAGGSARFEPADHPDLRPEHRNDLATAVGDWPGLDLARFRPVVLRAASMGGRVVGLTRLEGEATKGRPVPIAFNGLVVVDEAATLYRTDGAGRAAGQRRGWTPRL
ncbi:hypothetical protein [Brevundimonas sp. TWP2-3-2]|uniref:hypothetical protein n=1 Tax=unclassified Brevundimonas TaxID=2622653 RepID=UPI003CE77469